MPAETDASGDRCSAIVRTLLDVNTHFWFQDHSKRSFKPTCRGSRRPFAIAPMRSWSVATPSGGSSLPAWAMRHALPAVYNGREFLEGPRLDGLWNERDRGVSAARRLYGSHPQ